MEWTRLLSLALVVGIVALVAGSALELVRTTLGAADTVTASAATLGLVGLLILLTILVGARGPRWLRNPDHYW